MDNWLPAVLIGGGGAVFLAACIGVLIFLLFPTTPALEFTCVTKGAQLHSSDSKDGLYSKVWCVKDRKVVP